MRNMVVFFALLSGLCLFMIGCAHYPPTTSLTSYDENNGYRFNLLPSGKNSDSLFICLTFSGGGTRAGAFAYGALSKLAAVPITWKGETKQLLDEVDCISSVSGGSFTAAYYALYGDEIFKSFGEKFIYRDIEQDLLGKLLSPLNWIRLASPYFSRIDLAAELYDETIFDRKTFGDLMLRQRRPFLILNSTHLQSGERFEFSQSQFDLVGSDLLTFPVGRAVAASSAFPFLLSPITIENHFTPNSVSPPQDVKNGLKDYYSNPRLYAWAKSRVALTDSSGHHFVHVMDGGLADNIGLRAVADEYRRGFIRERINGNKIEKLVFIVVNAKTEPHENLDTRESPPDLSAVAYKTATISMDNYTFDTVELVRELAEERMRTQRTLLQCQKAIDDRCPGKPPLPALAGSGLEIYVIEINFDAVKDERERDCFLNLPTTFSLPSQQATALVEVAGELLNAHPKFQKLLDDLGVKPGPVRSEARTAYCQNK